MTDSRQLRDALEHAQQQNRTLQHTVTKLSTELHALKEKLAQSHAEQERLARLLLKGLNPDGGKSAFSVDNVAELVAYLKSH
jgi:multidrug resistance efflux pump